MGDYVFVKYQICCGFGRVVGCKGNLLSTGFCGNQACVDTTITITLSRQCRDMIDCIVENTRKNNLSAEYTEKASTERKSYLSNNCSNIALLQALLKIQSEMTDHPKSLGICSNFNTNWSEGVTILCTKYLLDPRDPEYDPQLKVCQGCLRAGCVPPPPPPMG